MAIFGIGHVGYELARILSRHEVPLHLVDSRAEQLDQLRLADVTDGVADVTVHRELIGEVVLDRLPRGAHVLIMTHDHAEDFALCDAALRNGRLGSIGLIGSSAKWARFRKLLAAEGHDAATIARITSPIGLPGLEGKEPAVIAVSVAAALLPVITSRPDALEGPTTSCLSLSKGIRHRTLRQAQGTSASGSGHLMTIFGGRSSTRREPFVDDPTQVLAPRRRRRWSSATG